ncbi:hypothetical protein AB0M80_27030 [Amycolatopsis sp. NPDC051045]|uniref:hypothetical protein n=1 Tax=Amycolatopsis sp. NPDC051045 TaxID=3156922 RepID=UPI0034425B28
MTTLGKKRTAGAKIAGLLVLVAIGYFAGVGVAAAVGSANPWTFGLIGIGPAIGGFYADTLGRRVRGGWHREVGGPMPSRRPPSGQPAP